MRHPVKSTIMRRQTVWQRKSPDFHIDELTVRMKDEAGQRDYLSFVSFERGESVAALIVNRDTSMVILVRQFRPCTIDSGVEDGLIIETPAGIVRQSETVEQCLQREIAEETGYRIEHDPDTGRLKDVELITEFFPSPGACSERIFLYFVLVDSSTPHEGGGGLPEEGEHVETVTMRLDEFFETLDGDGFVDSKILIAGHWLKRRLVNRPIDWRLTTTPGTRIEFELRSDPTKRIGYYCGDIGLVKDIDIWVNSENTNMQMDRLFGDSMSARIRTLGARFERDSLIEDTIQVALLQSLGIGSEIDPGNVLETTPGALEQSHKVQRLLHVSSVKAQEARDGQRRITTDIVTVRKCVHSALSHCRRMQSAWLPRRSISSIVLPIIGAGQAGLRPEEVIDSMVPMIVEHMRSAENCPLKRVYLLAYSPAEIEICDRILSRHDRLKRV